MNPNTAEEEGVDDLVGVEEVIVLVVHVVFLPFPFPRVVQEVVVVTPGAVEVGLLLLLDK